MSNAATTGNTSATESQSTTIKMNAISALVELLRDLRNELRDCENAQNDDTLSHDEMAALDHWWTDIDAKIDTTQRLLHLLDPYSDLHRATVDDE